MTLSLYLGTLADGLGCFPFVREVYPPRAHSQAYLIGIRGLIGFGKLAPPSPFSALPPTDFLLGLHLNAFRGEPAISGFDWHFTSTHNSSRDFAPSNGSGLHLDTIEASPWPWVAHQVSGQIPATKSPCSDSLSLRLRKSPCLTMPLRFTRRLILQ